MIRPFFLAVASFFLFACCAPRTRVEPAATVSEPDPEIQPADELMGRGCYSALKQAFETLDALYRRPELREKVADRFVKTSLLLAVRERELGIGGSTFLERAKEVIHQNPQLRPYGIYADIADAFWVQGKGVMHDIVSRAVPNEMQKNLAAAEESLLQKAGGDEFFAYMYAVRACGSPSAFGVAAPPETDKLEKIWSLFPNSRLLKFKRATCGQEDQGRLEELSAAEPCFLEAEYHLGNIALSRGSLLEAETHYLKAYAGIPESPQISISLASIAFAVEEFERSLTFYEQTLALDRDYRDALLGKAICLSYLGRHEEAIQACEKLLSLGFWLIGESYYWLAWNQHELKDNDKAAQNIEQAKSRLPTSTEVFTLSGILALERGDLARAESDLREALEYNSANHEALFQLGILYSRREDWVKSGTYFETAGRVLESAERALLEKIAELEASGMAEERKERLRKKKIAQLETTRLTRVTAFYNAAAGYFNSGKKEEAKRAASRAVEHPSFKQKAEELLSRIK